MVYRVFVSKKRQHAFEDRALMADIKGNLGIENLTDLRIYNRYDVEGIDKETFDICVRNVFSEVQVDDVFDSVEEDGVIFATEYLPGQFDQRADSAMQCIQFITGGSRPMV